MLKQVLVRSRFADKKKKYARWNQSKRRPSWHGIGVAAVFHGDGFTGGGEVFLRSQARVVLSSDGRIRVDAATTEIGQGTTSILAQIVADALEVPYDWVEVETPDTRKCRTAAPPWPAARA